MPKKKRPTRFSAAKAVRANARERLGQPPAARVLSEGSDGPRAGKYAETLSALLDRAARVE